MSPRSDPGRRLSSRLALGALAAFLVAVPFTLLLVLVEGQSEPLERLDVTTAQRLTGVARDHDWLLRALDVIAVALQPWAFRIVVLGVVAWLWHRGARRLALWALATTALGGVLGVVLKLVVARARPSLPDPVAHASGTSFPSGHALNSLLCVGVLILVFLPVLHRVGRAAAYGVGGLLVLVTGLDRIALGVHYVSDVLAGWVVAAACLAATTSAFAIWRREEGKAPADHSEGVEPEAAAAMSDERRPHDRGNG